MRVYIYINKGINLLYNIIYNEVTTSKMAVHIFQDNIIILISYLLTAITILRNCLNFRFENFERLNPKIHLSQIAD